MFAALQKATYIEQTLNLLLSFQISQAGAVFAADNSPEILSLRDTQLIIDHWSSHRFGARERLPMQAI